jgi:hypothetical protein
MPGARRGALVRQVRTALTRLHDLPYLQTHPLGELRGKGYPARAARLAGVADALFVAGGVPPSRGSQAGLGEMLATARDADPSSYDAAFANGRRMSLEQAVAYARSDEAEEPQRSQAAQ